MAGVSLIARLGFRHRSADDGRKWAHSRFIRYSFPIRLRSLEVR